MWKSIGLGLCGIVALLLAYVALQPAAFTVERSISIAAPPDVVFRHIDDLRALDAWSPWAGMDPALKTKYEGPAAGVGAGSSWKGPQIGKGKLRITAVKPDQEVEMQLEMIEPLRASHRVKFILVPTERGTGVTWRLEGHNGFLAKAFTLLLDVDDMLGGEFTKGLEKLKSQAEAEAAQSGSS